MAPRQPGGADKSSDTTLLEVLGIFLVGVSVGGLALIWAGRPLPPEIEKFAGGVFRWITGGAGAAATLWSAWNKRGGNATRIFGGSCGVALGFAGLVLAISRVPSVVPQGKGQTFSLAFQRLEYGGNSNEAVVRLHQVEPINKTDKDRDFTVHSSPFRLVPATDYFDMPPGPDGNKFFADVLMPADPVTGSSSGVTDQKSKAETEFLWHICVDSDPKHPGEPNTTVTLDCEKGKHCQLVTPPAWARPCSGGESSSGPASPTPGYFLLNAAEVPKTTAETAGKNLWWRIPTLSTLQKVPADKRPGYTVFTIQSRKIAGADDANTFTYALRSNGVNLLVDGLDPGNLRLPFDPKKGLNLTFALENLNFSGEHAGCESLEVGVDFQKAGREVKHVDLSRQYAALRQPMSVTPTSPDGSLFDWGGYYVKSTHEGTHEILAGATEGSPKGLGAIQKWKKDVDEADLIYLQQQVTAVIRPPLRAKEKYGLVLGLTHDNGQVQYTFARDFAEAFRNWALQKRREPAAGKVLQSPPYTRLTGDQIGNRPGACESFGF
jgi:hypothetical protein